MILDRPATSATSGEGKDGLKLVEKIPFDSPLEQRFS